IGLNTDIKAMIKAGPRALLLGASTWMAVILSSLSVQYLIQTW
ncbi:MAG: putative sulfate exporter family transporter, partial [Chloroflexi bacterium]|nr:putative sulfate exporter family transporter [Chloroflexota bacterium]